MKKVIFMTCILDFATRGKLGRLVSLGLREKSAEFSAEMLVGGAMFGTDVQINYSRMLSSFQSNISMYS